MKHNRCNDAEHIPVGRRELLKVGGMSLIGAEMADVMRLEADASTSSSTFGKAKSVVFIFQSGGPSQHETFDPKPDAPETIRGEYSTTQTKLPGVNFCEYLPKLAARADRFSIVRTMRQHFNSCHGGCNYLLNTGTTALPRGETNASIVRGQIGGHAWPSISSMIAYAKEEDRPSGGLPPVLEIPRLKNMKYPGREGGLLGPQFDRVGLDLAPTCKAPDAGGSCPNCYSHDDPNLDPERKPGPGPKAWWDNTSCRNPDFHLPSPGHIDISSPVLLNRETLRQKLDALEKGLEQADNTGRLARWDLFRRQALDFIMASRRTGSQNPFDLTQESEATLKLYGREEWGQGFLAARRLIEAGVRMVQVTLRGWDTHQNAFRDLRNKALPSLDHCLSGFLDDLEDRGLLDETLVVMCGEMGRTPKVQPISPNGKNASGEIFTPGRDHWGHVLPCFFAGGGIQPGRVIGKTDSNAGYPQTEAYSTEDFAATIFHCLGIGPEREFHDSVGRPYRIYRGKPIQPLL